ncbi:regucalcin [Neolentinus lepideus HHB14362 ss-1]|uniref:Regucalcin n=1 Tax=Neolentinus lepideus HHB14362 ss-1 TaxID=1314782 RepID=A0A165W0W2_9AGAM|nr:regucalcin [Neolentinus lepideus HHB14362 ss-1]
MVSKQIHITEPLLKVGCTLGEGPLYDQSTSTLHFVDIDEKKVYHLNVTTNVLSVDKYDESITCLSLRRDGRGLACTTAAGYALLEASQIKYLSQPIPSDQLPYVRFNDGACDSKGRYFAGTLYSKDRNIPGRLWRYDPADESCAVVDDGPFTDSNGIGWSLDGKTMYFVDSLVNYIFAYDYEDGVISNRRVFIDALAQGQPMYSFPDGLCIDSEGGIWSARWGGSRIVRYTKEGVEDLEIHFPKVLNVTACCFGGPNDDQLYVTTAHCGAVGGDPSRQASYPDSGHLFVVDLAGQYTGGVWRHTFGA